MKQERVKELLPIMTAYAQGCEIESRIRNGPWGLNVDPLWLNDHEYRIKPPDVELILLTSNDLPPIIWLKFSDGSMELVTAIDECGYLDSQNANGNPKILHKDNVMWSEDRKTWHDFIKIEEMSQ